MLKQLSREQENPRKIFTQSISCAHQTFDISVHDKRVKTPPEDKVFVHVCDQLKVWQEPYHIVRYYLYDNLKISEV